VVVLIMMPRCMCFAGLHWVRLRSNPYLFGWIDHLVTVWLYSSRYAWK
jgi:hypothetical protein